MEQNQNQERSRSGWLTYQAVEAIVAVLILLIGAVMMKDALRIGIGWASDGPQGGYFPFRTGAILILSSIVILLRALFGKNRNHRPFASWKSFQRVLFVLVPALLYVAFTQFIGIYVASALFIGGFMRVIGKFSWLKVTLVSAVIGAMLFYMFEVQFLVPLPKGPLESLFGY